MTGPIEPTGLRWHDDRNLEILAPMSETGEYEVSLGPTVRDARGNALDQNQNGVLGEAPDDRFVMRVEHAELIRVSGIISQNTIHSSTRRL